VKGEKENRDLYHTVGILECQKRYCTRIVLIFFLYFLLIIPTANLAGPSF